MKRVYRNNDITFNLTVNCFPFKPELIDRIDFKFYTMNKNNFISKTKADIVNDTLILEWSELSKLEQGVLNYSYDVGQKDPKYGDNYLNQVSDVITDYFIMSGKDGIDVPSNATKWGDITGDVNNQQDLVSLIDLKIKGINIGEYAKKTDIPTKNSQLENDSKYLVENDIAGKVDNTTYTKEKQEFLAIVGKKADKTEIPTKVSELINDSNFTTDSKVAVNHYTKDEINNVQKTLATKDEISDMATKTWTNQQNYLKEVPSEYVTESELISKDYATKTDVSKKLDISTYNNDKSNFATKSDLNKKQNTLVSGSNIKTINNQSLLGSGNITITGGGGGAVNSVNGKTGDVTITAEELGAATVEELNSKLDKMEAVSTSLTHVTIRPNVLYTFTGKPTSLTINFAAHEHQDEFIFKFSSGEVPTTLSLPKQISWIGSTPLKIEANKQYIVSIFAGIAVGGAF